MRNSMKMPLLALVLTACGSSEDGFDLALAENKDATMREIRDLAEAACACEFSGGDRVSCRKDTEQAMAGLTRTPWPVDDRFLVGQGYCFPELDGQCFTYGQFVREDPENQFLCRSDDISDVLLVYEQRLQESGGDRAAAEASAMTKFGEVRTARMTQMGVEP